MKLGVSNIAWEYKHEPEYLQLLKNYSFKTLEIAPTKIWPNIAEATEDRCKEYKEVVSTYDISINSMQSALFGTSNLNIFITPQKTLKYLCKVLQICEWIGITKMVFGSPKNRFIPESMLDKDAKISAISFFKQLATEASFHGICICLEPNAKEYGCNFLTTVS